MRIAMLLLVPVGLTLFLSLLAFWVWMLVDCLTKEQKADNDRLVWALVIVFTKLFGAALYYFLRYRRRGDMPLVRNGPGLVA